MKPSVMKPAMQVNAAQKRKRAVRSAVAAVKPLNSASIVFQESQQETDSKEEVSSGGKVPFSMLGGSKFSSQFNFFL